ncbi:MAG: hypothetical protein GEU97_21830 [Actinophytocola sp.]|nr:hypothetical protein [Actinophytocola sp.]
MTVSGGWPDLGLSGLWSGLTAALAPEEATAEPAGQRQASVPCPAAAQQDKKKPKPPKRVRELPGKRTATAKVFAMSDGTFEAEVFTKPLR